VREAPTAEEHSRGDGSPPRAAGECSRRGEERRDEREVREVAATQERGPRACQDRPGEPREPGCLAAAARQRRPPAASALAGINAYCTPATAGTNPIPSALAMVGISAGVPGRSPTRDSPSAAPTRDHQR